MTGEFCKVCPCPKHGFSFCPWKQGIFRHPNDHVCGWIEDGKDEWVGETLRQAQLDSGHHPTFGSNSVQPALAPILRMREPGKIRVAFVVPCLKIGGAERWTEAIITALQCDPFELIGCGVLYKSGDSPEQFVSERMPLYFEESGIRHLAPHADVLICWGVPNVVRMTAHSAAKRVLVCHGLGRFDIACLTESRHAEQLVSVSAQARFAFPESVRSRVKISPNAVRIPEPSLSVPRIRERLGIYDDRKILGWLGRIAPEKNPGLFVDRKSVV